MKRFIATLVAGAVLAMTAASAQAACPTTLGHLAGKLPNYPNAKMQQFRQMALDTDVLAAYRKGLSQGLSPTEMTKMAFAQVDQAKLTMSETEQCIDAISTDPVGIKRALRDGTHPLGGSNALAACQEAYVLSYYMLVANEEAAIAWGCYAREGIR